MRFDRLRERRSAHVNFSRCGALAKTSPLSPQIGRPNMDEQGHQRCASKILHEYGKPQSELTGKAVVLTDGKAGTVENVWLDELHGLRISIKGHDGRWPVSTIKLVES